MKTTVVVGYDESPASERALAVAAQEAELHGVALEIVNVFPRWETAAPITVRRDTAARETAQSIAAHGAETARELCPAVSVQTSVLPGRPDDVLAEAAQDGAMLVLGDREHHDFKVLEEGAITVHTLDKTTCPVLVLNPEEHEPRDRMVVAVNLDEPTGELLGFAFEEAARRGVPLHAINVWDRDATLDLDFDALDDELTAERKIVDDRESYLAAALAPWRARYPEVECHPKVLIGQIGRLLIDASVHADLLVTGAHRHAGAQPGVAIGPAVHTLLHHADCPLAVVPIG